METLIILMSMGLLNSQIQDMNRHVYIYIYTRYQKVFEIRLFLDSCQLVFTFSPFFLNYKLWLFLFEVTLISPIALQQNSSLGCVFVK